MSVVGPIAVVCVCACVCVCWRAPVHFGLISPLSHSVLSFIIMFTIMCVSVVWSCIRIKGDVSLEKTCGSAPSFFMLCSLNYADNPHHLLHISKAINNWSNRYLSFGPTGIGPRNISSHLVQLVIILTGPWSNGPRRSGFRGGY